MVMLNGTVEEVPSGTEIRTKQTIIHWATMKFVENKQMQHFLSLNNNINVMRIVFKL